MCPVKHLIRLLYLVGVLEEEIFARFKMLKLLYIRKPTFLAAVHMQRVDSIVSSQLHIYCCLCFIGLCIISSLDSICAAKYTTSQGVEGKSTQVVR